MKNECSWEVDIEFKILMRKVKSPLKQTTPLQICSAPFLNSPEVDCILMHQSIPPATAGHLLALSVPGWGICKFCSARGPGFCQPQGHYQAFDTQAVSYQNNNHTQKVLLEIKNRLAHQGQE